MSNKTAYDLFLKALHDEEADFFSYDEDEKEMGFFHLPRKKKTWRDRNRSAWGGNQNTYRSTRERIKELSKK